MKLVVLHIHFFYLKVCISSSKKSRIIQSGRPPALSYFLCAKIQSLALSFVRKLYAELRGFDEELRGEKLLRGVIRRCEISLFQKTPDIAKKHLSGRKVRRPLLYLRCFGIDSGTVVVRSLRLCFKSDMCLHLGRSAAILPHERRWRRS